MCFFLKLLFRVASSYLSLDSFPLFLLQILITLLDPEYTPCQAVTGGIYMASVPMDGYAGLGTDQMAQIQVLLFIPVPICFSSAFPD